MLCSVVLCYGIVLSGGVSKTVLKFHQRSVSDGDAGAG